MDIQFREEEITGIPVMIVSNKEPAEACQKGTVLFYHGLLSNKMGSEKELRSLASCGYLVVSVDNYGHGNRKINDFNTRFHSHNENFEKNFIEAVENTMFEAPNLIDELSKKELIYDGKLGICGISMGGFITYGITSIEKRIKAACPIAGCPKWKSPNSPHHKPQNFYPTALLAQNGGSDVSVWPKPARKFNQKLIPHYAADPERLVYVEFEGEGHFMSEQGWYFLWENVIKWFEFFL